MNSFSELLNQLSEERTAPTRKKSVPSAQREERRRVEQLDLDLLAPSPPKPNKEEKPDAARADEIIRAELNFEKWAHVIFAPAHSKSLYKPRSFTYLETRPDGSKVAAFIIAELYRGRTLSTQSRRVLLALLKIAQAKGCDREERVTFSLRELADALNMKWAGKKTIEHLKEELFQLRATFVHWKFSFENAQGERVTVEDGINFLESLRIKEKEHREKREYYESLNTFRFHEEIRNNLKAGITKPVNYTVALSLRSELAQILYAHLDFMLANRPRYERTTKGIFQDLKLEIEKRYRYPSGRKLLIQKATKELHGKPVNSGVLNLSFTKTKDGADYKLIALKKLPLFANLPEPKLKPQPANPPELIPLLVEDMRRTIRGYQPEDETLFATLAKRYPANLLEQALSELKADGGDAKNPIALFQTIVHRLAHRNSQEWISPCDCG